MPELFPEDQQRVNEVLSKGVYQVDRKPFRPWLLLFWIIVVLGGISAVSYLIAASYDFV